MNKMSLCLIAIIVLITSCQSNKKKGNVDSSNDNEISIQERIENNIYDSILKNVYYKLNNLKTVRYDLTRELSYASEEYHSISKWICYFDFSLSNNPIHFKYQIDDSISKNIFNGTEKFELNKPAKTIQVKENPEKESFEGLSFLYNSLITIKNILPTIIDDQYSKKAISDTVINNQSYELVTINVGKRRVQNLGKGFDIMKTKYDFIYKLIIDKNSYFPIEIIQKNNLNNDFIKTSFTNLSINPTLPSETSWYYSTYTNEYQHWRQTTFPNILPVGSLAPDMKLKAFKDNEQLSLSEFRGKVILLDFWIKNCGPCILSVPHLNKLQDKFNKNDFELLSVNAYDSKEEVGKFINKHNIKYQILIDGKTVAEKYGVSGFPALFIIDKSGKIIHSQFGFNESTISTIEDIIKTKL